MLQTLKDWGTGKNTEKYMFPFAGQIPCGGKPLCEQTLTQTFLGYWRRIQVKGA